MPRNVAPNLDRPGRDPEERKRRREERKRRREERERKRKLADATKRARELDALTNRARKLLASQRLDVALATLLLEHVEAARTGSDDRLVSARDAGIPPRTWRQEIASGALPGVLIGRQYFARHADVQRYLAEHAASASERPTRRRRARGNPDLDNLAASGSVQLAEAAQ